MTFIWRCPSATERQTCNTLILGIIDTSCERVSVQVSALGQSGRITPDDSRRWHRCDDHPEVHRVIGHYRTRPRIVVGREFGHCGHFIERFVTPDLNVYRYMRTFGISVRYQPAHVTLRSGEAQNPCPSATSATIRHEIFLHFTFRILFRT